MNYLQQKKHALISVCQPKATPYIWDYTLFPLTFNDVGFSVNEYLTNPFVLTSNGYEINSLTPAAWRANEIYCKNFNKEQYDIILNIDRSIGKLRILNNLQLSIYVPFYNGKRCNLLLTNNSIYYQNLSFNQKTISNNFGDFNSIKLTIRNNMITFYKGNHLSNWVKIVSWDSTNYQFWTNSNFSILFQATEANQNKSLLIKHFSIANIK